MGNSRGTALIETSITITALAVILSFTLPLLYFLFSKIWVRHSLHEGLICLLEQRSHSECSSVVHRSIDLGLPIGSTELVRLQKNTFKVSGRVEFRLSRNLLVIKGLTLRNASLEEYE